MPAAWHMLQPVSANAQEDSDAVRDSPDAFGSGAGEARRFRGGGKIFRTYFTSARGLEAVASVWSFLDLTPLGRQETWEDSPHGYPQTPPFQWWRRHDEY